MVVIQVMIIISGVKVVRYRIVAILVGEDTKHMVVVMVGIMIILDTLAVVVVQRDTMEMEMEKQAIIIRMLVHLQNQPLQEVQEEMEQRNRIIAMLDPLRLMAAVAVVALIGQPGSLLQLIIIQIPVLAPPVVSASPSHRRM